MKAIKDGQINNIKDGEIHNIEYCEMNTKLKMVKYIPNPIIHVNGVLNGETSVLPWKQTGGIKELIYEKEINQRTY